MKWFQQNRAFATFLIAFAICALLFGALVYRRWSIWTAARQTFEQAAAERNRLKGLDPFPNEVNQRRLQEHLDKYSVALRNFKEALKAEVAPAPPLAPNEFQSRLRQAVVATLDRARKNNVKLPERFQLGFDEFARIMPNTAVTPLLGQELSQVQMLINILLDAKVDSVTSFHRMPLPEERGITPTPTPTPVPAGRKGSSRGPKPVGTSVAGPKLLERNIVDLTFKATPAAARKVLNQISSSNGQFYIVRTLYVRNEKDKGPPREKTAEANPPANQPTAPDQPGGAPLSFIVGNEHIEILATIEMLRFTF